MCNIKFTKIKTLLSFILGDHPRSFTQNIKLFGKMRNQIATPQLAKLIGTISPEIASAFPKFTTMTAFDVVNTGYSGIYCFRKTQDENERKFSLSLLKELAPNVNPDSKFNSLNKSEKSCIFLARSLVNQSPLIVLDEPFQGMNETDLHRCRNFLQTKLNNSQTIIFITHYENEVPWNINKGKILRLKDGEIDYVH